MSLHICQSCKHKEQGKLLGRLPVSARPAAGAGARDGPALSGRALRHRRLTGIVYPDGRSISYNYTGTLDGALSRLTSISDASGTLESYEYLGLGTVVERTQGNGVKLTYIKQSGESDGEAGDQYAGLDRFGRVVDQRWIDGTNDLDRYAYTYDRDSNRTAKANTLNGDYSETYEYDGLNRLITVSRDSVEHQSWDLDQLGNANSVTTDGTQQDREHNAQNQLIEMGTATLAYDDNGNETTDQNGWTFIYDAWNRQVEVKDGQTSLVRYAFDGLNRRISEGGSEDYYSAQWQQVEQRDGSGSVTTQYVYSPVYVDAIIERDRSVSGTLDERVWVMQDANYDVTGIADGSGTVLQRFVYDAYGKRTVLGRAVASHDGRLRLPARPQRRVHRSDQREDVLPQPHL